MKLIQPLACLAVLALMFATQVGLLKASRPRLGWRESVLTVATLWGVAIWAATEFLSLFHQITLLWITALWALAALGTAVAGLARRRVLGTQLQAIAQRWRDLRAGRSEKLILLATLFGLACLGLIAWVAAPNNWDSQTYHLSRVMHWIQNQSLAFYPTSIPRQLYLGPGAEILVLHLQILGGGDRLANFVQYAAMLGSLVGAPYIAKLLGGSARAQLFAVVAVATIPMGILQATSTQSDYVTGFWLVCFVSFGLPALKRTDWLLWVLVGSSLGLAIVTKSTSYMFAAPFAVWIGVSLLRRGPVPAIKAAALIGGMVLLINSGEYIRNDALYGSVLGPGGEASNITYANELYTPAALLSNVVRNVALHLAVPQFNQVNAFTERRIVGFHSLLGLAIDDARTTWFGQSFQIVFSRHEDTAGNLLHLALVVGALGLLVAFKKARSAPLALYAGCALTGFLLFCYLLKWQPWNSRLHLPLFLLLMPWAAVVLEKSLSRAALFVLMIGLMVWSLPFVFRNESRPLLGSGSILNTNRASQYFANSPDLEAPYRDVAQLVGAGTCRQIGLILGGDQWEYPLWALSGAAQPPLQMEHVNVQNASGRLPAAFVPCTIIDGTADGDTVNANGATYAKEFEEGPLKVYVLQPAAPMTAVGAPRSYYVATRGFDDDAGTLTAPFRTIQRCADIAEPGDTCFIRAGVYRETVSPAHSGTEVAPIFIMPYNKEIVTIDGSEPLADWSAYRGQIYQAVAFPNPALAGNQVFVDGVMLPEARWPNTGLDPMLPSWATAGPGTAGGVLDDPNLPAIDWAGATAHIWGGTDPFVHQTAVVSASAPGHVTLAGLRPELCPIVCLGPGANYYLTGVLAALDSPTEWFYDAGTHRVYLWAAGDANPNQLNVSMKQRTYALELQGRSYIHVVGLKLFASSILIDDSSAHNVVEGIEADCISHYTTLPPPAAGLVVADKSSDYAAIVPAHAADSGLIINGTHNVVRDSLLAYSAGNGVLLAGSYNTVDNNVIHDVGYMGSYATAVYVVGHHQTVTNKTIYNTARDGVTVDWHLAGLAFLFNTIAHNDISRFGMLSVDAGGIYLCCSLDGSGTTIAYNMIHDPANPSPSAKLAALYPDNGSSHFLFHHNVVWDTVSSVAANGGPNNVWYNNTFAAGSVDVAGEFFNNVAPQANLSQDGNNLAGGVDPLFTDAAHAIDTLQPGSPAIDIGRLFLGLNDDFIGAAPDAGAYEYGRAMWGAGSTLAVKPADRLIQAELFSAGHGVTIAFGSTLVNLIPGTWAKYSNVDFGAGVSAIVFMASVPASDADNQIDVRLDGGGGPLLGRFELTATVAGQSFVEQTFPIQPVSGRHDLFVIGRRGLGQLALDWLTFQRSEAATTKIEAEAYSNQSGVQTYATYVGSLDDGHWLSYANVDFGAGVSGFEAHLAANSGQTDQRLDIHLDSLGGPLLGALTVKSTGSWTQFNTQSASVTLVSGKHSVFLVARGGFGVCNLDWFTFQP
jgi:Carbohydrate binding module (family 6)/Right handed beta helix region/Dolichyl-phosphate-mannose-protein mannosyltransferase